jgi:alpha-galactosidase
MSRPRVAERAAPAALAGAGLAALALLLAGPAAARVPARAAGISGARGASTRVHRGAHAPGRRAAAGVILTPTPYMGWDTYFTFGARFSESSVLQEASRLISLGLRARGYDYVWLDSGWWQGARAPNGQILVNHAQWPHGMAWLTQTLHAAGLRVGIYTDAGRDGCGGAGQGSYGHYQQDANTFAAWGFDAVKVDFCGGSERHLNPAAAYGAFHAALAANASHRPMLLSICDFLQPGQNAEGEPSFSESAFTSYTFGPSDGSSWRTDTDVGFPGHVEFADVLRNMDADAAVPQAAGPGHWNDPDYLGPDQGLSAAQFRTQLSMWAVPAAPLMVSDDLTRISAASLEAIRNSEVIAVDQDPAGVQGTLVSSSGAGQVWVKPLSDGSRAVALLNRGSSPLVIRTSASAVGLPAAGSYLMHDLWAHSAHASSGAIASWVGGDSTTLLRVYPR